MTDQTIVAGASTSVEADYDEYNAAGRIWGQVPRERIKKIKFPRISAEIRQAYLELDDMTTTVSDVLDSLGIAGVIPATHMPPVIPGSRCVGTAVTLRNIPERKTATQGYVDKEPIKMSTREIYYMSEEGDVLVGDFGGNTDVSNMGGMSCTVGKSKGFTGAIIWGAVRDVPTIREINYPVWSAGVTPITGKFRIETMEINGPITVRGLLVEPGDLVVADDSGICFVPAEHVEYVLQQAREINGAEDSMRDMIENNVSVADLKPHFRKRYS